MSLMGLVVAFCGSRYGILTGLIKSTKSTDYPSMPVSCQQLP